MGDDPVEIGKVIADLPEGQRVVRTERAVRAPHRLSLIVADKSQAELISDHQALAKEYRQELAQIISFNDFLSVPREFSKAV